MKFLVAIFLLALASSVSAGVYKTFKEIEDRGNNGNKKDALALTGNNEILQESQDRITDNLNLNALPSDGLYETRAESKDLITKDNNADEAALADVNETREENEDPITNYYNADAMASSGVNETHKNIEGRITNDHTAYTGQLPYQAFLGIQTYSGASWCGASLISSEWVLTAAHCIYTAYSVTVYLGSVQRYYGTSRTVPRQNIIIHNGYVPGYNHNDIALIKIPAVSLNSSHIQPVKLPPLTNYPKSYEGEYAIASGWGQTTDTNYYGSDYLQWARLPIITNNECAKTYGHVKSGIVCASTPNRASTCFGDSGGPLVLESSKIQIGIFSFAHSSRRCTSGYPVGFTRLTSYLDWIRYYTGIYYT